MAVRHLIATTMLLALAACGRGQADAPGADDFLLAEGTDPALTSVLHDQFLTDPNLTQQAHPNTIRPPEAPVQAQYPAGSANEGIPATASPGRALCGAEFESGAEWARNLPGEFPLYPGSRIVEAAGSDAGGCHMRTVTMQTPDAYRRVLDHYRTLAQRAGFAVEQRPRGTDHMLAGVSPRTGAVFVLVVTPLERGSEAALIVDTGA